MIADIELMDKILEIHAHGDGRDRWMADETGIVVEAIGPRGLWSRPPCCWVLPWTLTRRFCWSPCSSRLWCPGWEGDGVGWVTENVKCSIGNPVFKDVGSRRDKLEVYDALGMMAIAVEPR